jgi:glutamate/aspartate transport system permease protein
MEFDTSIVWQAAPYLWEGLKFTLSLTAAAFAIGMALGIVLALVQHL